METPRPHATRGEAGRWLVNHTACDGGVDAKGSLGFKKSDSAELTGAVSVNFLFIEQGSFAKDSERRCDMISDAPIADLGFSRRMVKGG